MHFFKYILLFLKNTPKAVALLLCMVANQQFRLKLLKQKQLMNPALFTSSKLLALFVVGKEGGVLERRQEQFETAAAGSYATAIYVSSPINADSTKLLS